MATDENDLSLVDSTAMILELERRHPLGFCFIAEAEEGGRRFWRRYFNGPPSTIIGMLARAHKLVLDDADAPEEDDSDE
jgi:hypothetical protein